MLHFSLQGAGIKSLEDIGWFRLDEGINHIFASTSQDLQLPDADFIFWCNNNISRRKGQPLTFIQGYRVFARNVEEAAYRSPCPKICTATWLVDVGKQLGVPTKQLVHIPYGLKHEKYRLVTPLNERPFRISMVHSNHPKKGASFGLAALKKVKRKFPEVDVVVFGTQDPDQAIPSWMTFRKSPDQTEIVNEIYNKSRVFVMPSILEGFGLPCIEAMACGCALVTTANGGSRDYAIHGETALVSEPSDVRAMADHIENLLTDDGYRISLAMRGLEYVKRFSWEKSTGMLEAFLKTYGKSPEYYQRPDQ
jgi:glycosyltransferase involved in cell wall biosynthesis